MLGSTTPVAYVSNLFLYNGEEAIGTSTIGVTGLLVANSGHNVNVIDVNTNRITNLIQVPINPAKPPHGYVDAKSKRHHALVRTDINQYLQRQHGVYTSASAPLRRAVLSVGSEPAPVALFSKVRRTAAAMEFYLPEHPVWSPASV